MQAGRVLTSRIIFACTTLSLQLLQIGIALSLIELEEYKIDVSTRWSVKATDLASGAINSMLPFMLKNLIASFLIAGTLAVRTSDVVFVKLDPCAHRILLATHEFLIDERYRVGSKTRQRAIGLAVAVAALSS